MKYKIITPPAAEPVSLAEAKLHLRVESGTFDGDVATHQSIVPGSHAVAASYSLVGAAVDVLGMISLVTLNAGTCGAGGSVTAKLQESADGTTWTDVTGGTFTTVTAANDNAVQEIQYTGRKQYVRVAATVAGAVCDFSAEVLVKSGDVTEDTLISDLITAAREFCEAFTRRALAAQTIELYMDNFPCGDIQLPMPPLVSVTSVKYKDSAGTETTMTADTDYIVDTDSDIARLVLPYGKRWPSFTPYPVNPIAVRYEAGYTTVPKTVKQAILLLLGHWYENRSAVLTGSISKEIEFAVRALLYIHKAGWF